MKKPLNPIADHLKGIVTFADVTGAIPKEGPVPLKQVAGGIVKRRPVDRTAAIVTAPANWMCKPIFDKVEPQTISHELELLRDELRKVNVSIQAIRSKLKAKEKECSALKLENQELRKSLGIMVDSCEHNLESMAKLVMGLS